MLYSVCCMTNNVSSSINIYWINKSHELSWSLKENVIASQVSSESWKGLGAIGGDWVGKGVLAGIALFNKSAASIIKNTQTIVLALGSNKLYTHYIIKFGPYYIFVLFFSLITRPENKEDKI